MKYYILDTDRRQIGPLSIYDLKDRGISRSTLVWAEGMTDWQEAGTVEELQAALFAHQAPPPPPPPLRPAYSVPPTHKSGFPLGKVVAVLCLLLMLAMLFSNPSEEAHRTAVRKAGTRAIERIAEQRSVSSTLTNYLLSVGEKYMNQLLDRRLEYHNYLLCSTTTFSTESGEHTITIGVFGHVFSLANDEIERRFSDSPVVIEQVIEAASPRKQQSSAAPQAEQSGKDKIIEGVGDIVKEEISRRTDSNTVGQIEELIKQAKDYLK